MRAQTLVLATITASCTNQAADDRHKDMLITDVTIISSERASPSDPIDVLIQNGVIEKIAVELDISEEDIDQIIDGEGRYLTPGLIDGHTHLDEVPGMTFEHEIDNPEVSRAARAQIPKSYLYYGFTTVIDLNGRKDTVAAWNRMPVRPQAHFCGAAPVFDGYPMSWMPMPVRYQIMPYFLYDETRADDFPNGFDPADHTPEAVVERMKSDGAICVKTHYEPGFGGRGNLPTPSVEKIRALVAAAHHKVMPVLLHANSQRAQAFGVNAGVDAFAHGMWTWDDQTATELNDSVMETLDGALVQNIALQPTIQVLYGERDLHSPDYLSDPALKTTTPQSLLDWYHTDDGQWWRRRMMNIPYFSQLVETGRWEDIDAEPIARASSALRYFLKNEGRLLFGSDTPSDPTYANPPGLNGRREFDNWRASGVTPTQLFHAATLSNAQFFGLDEKIGTVEVGKQADLLLLRENPLETSTAYDSIELVIVDGKAHSRSSLAAQ